MKWVLACFPMAVDIQGGMSKGVQGLEPAQDGRPYLCRYPLTSSNMHLAHYHLPRNHLDKRSGYL